MKTLALTAIILTSAALSGTAIARTFRLHGTICYHTLDGFAADYTQFGVHNIGSSAITVECPLPLSYPSSGVPPLVTQVQAKVYDRNTSDDVNCALQEVDQNGTIVVSAPNHSTNGGPGSAAVNLVFTPPAPVDTTGYWRLRCSIPGVQTAGAFSHVTTIVVNTTE